MKLSIALLGASMFLFTACTNNQQVLEVTTFKLNATADAAVFNELDAKIEGIFTSKQPGFIKRQSAVDENGAYVVLVYWSSVADAEASMQKFMKDASVADYASMIDGESMQMARYQINNAFTADDFSFIEVMSFNTKADTDLKAFNETNNKVETGFTAKQKGFLQRITGIDEAGKQVVAVYWDNKTNSDAALEPFMENEISKTFMGMMDQTSIQFGRYEVFSSK